MKAKSEEVEIRFAVVSAAALTQYGDFINYYQVNNTPGNTEEKDVRDAADELKALPDGGILRGAFQDDVAIGTKRPWRAILKRKKEKQFLPSVGDDEAYGIVINPPYPR